MDKQVKLSESAGGALSTPGWRRARRLAAHYGPILARALLATALLWLAASIPVPFITFQLFLALRTPLAILIGIVYIGKLLIDTFFYDHYM